MLTKSQGQRKFFDSGMADSEENFVHFAEVLSDQDLPRNFLYERTKRQNLRKPQHNTAKRPKSHSKVHKNPHQTL